MNFNQFKREAKAVAQGQVTPSVAATDRALRKKELTRCALALTQFASTCLDARHQGDRPQRRTPPPELLPPVA